MSQLNSGPLRARTRVSVTALFGIVFFGVALLGMLPRDAISVGTPSSKTSNPGDPASLNYSCWQAVSSPNRGSPGGLLNAVAAVSANDVWAVGGYGSPRQTLIEHWNGTLWSVVLSPNQGTSANYLYAVAAVGADDVWAVGNYDYYNGSEFVSQTLIEHWNGTLWSVVLSPNQGTSANYLNGVSAVGSDDVWAVGYSGSSYDYDTLVEHWNGIAWSVISSPTPSFRGRLSGVAAVSTNDVWAVGYSYDGTNHTLVERWNGTAWSVVPSPNQGSDHNELRGVFAVGSDDVWAVGTYFNLGALTYGTLIEHWNGTAWSVVPSPNAGTYSNDLYAVAAISTNDVWAVGTAWDLSDPYPPTTTRTLIEHWDGSAWSVVPSPDEGGSGNGLYGVAAVGANDVWTVGGATQTLVGHWNGIAWSVISSPNQGAGVNHLNAVAAVTANDVWAVGYHSYYVDNGVTYQTLVEHWNGTEWSVIPSANPSTDYNELYGVAVVSADDVWAVGAFTGGTLVEHWNGTEWSVVPSPNLDTPGGELYAVAAAGPDDVWAVGRYFSNPEPYEDLVEHWNGTEWSVVSHGRGATLSGVAAVSANDVWAVGYYDNMVSADGTLGAQTSVEHWNGTEWSTVPSPSPGYHFNRLYGVAAVSANDVWAVGSYNLGAYTYGTLIEHWNGSTWSTAHSPNASANNILYGVAAVSANDVWAVGSYYYVGTGTYTYRTLIEHWNGIEWSVVSSPNPGTYGNELSGVAAVAADDAWAVGYYNTEGTDWTLAGEFVPCATPTNTPTPTACSIQFNDVPEGSAFYPFITCLACRGIIVGYPDRTFNPNNNITRGQLAKVVSNAAGFSDSQATQMFQDVPVGSTFFQYIGRLASRGYMTGYPCGGVNEQCVPPDYLPYFRSNNKATRGQLTKIVSNAAGFQDDIPTSVQTFADVIPTSTYWWFVERLLLNRPGVMGGYPCGGANEPCDPQRRPYFRPGNNVTRGQTSKIVANTFFPGCQGPAGPKR